MLLGNAGKHCKVISDVCSLNHNSELIHTENTGNALRLTILFLHHFPIVTSCEFGNRLRELDNNSHLCNSLSQTGDKTQ